MVIGQGEMEIECPFCSKGKIIMYHKEGYLQAKTSRISAGAKVTMRRVGDKYIVKTNCPNCGKTKEEIERAFDTGETKQVSHEERLKRLRESGLPTRVES
jgi:sarcosine oxidase delta subunit